MACCMAFVWARLPNDKLESDEPRLANRLFCCAPCGDATGLPKPPPALAAPPPPPKEAPPPNTGGPPNVAGDPNAGGDPNAKNKIDNKFSL